MTTFDRAGRRPFFWRGRIEWRTVGFDFLCRECWRYSQDDIPWCGHTDCASPRWWNFLRRWRAYRG